MRWQALKTFLHQTFLLILYLVVLLLMHYVFNEYFDDGVLPDLIKQIKVIPYLK